MKLSEFTKQPQGHWMSNARFASQLGDFVLELDIGAGMQPDDRMLTEAAQLLEEFEQFSFVVAEKIFEHYTRAESKDGWLQSCGVPSGLSLEGVAPYLKSRTLVISRDDRDGESYYTSRIYVSPAWDMEHGIHLGFQPEGLVFE